MLQNKAMLVDLTIHQWTARKHDKQATTEVERTHGAKNAGHFNKQLVAKEALQAISRKGNEIRAYHYAKTLPWSDSGPRLLPAELFMEYRSELSRLKGEFNLLVSQFIQNYPSLVQKAQQHLKTLFHPNEYPEASELYKRFDVSTEIMPIPAGSDFRTDLADAERAQIQREIEDKLNERQTRATRECYVRVKGVLERMSKQCIEGKTVITDTLASQAHEIATTLDKLNITNDPELTRLAREMREDLLVSADTLRNDPQTRKEVGDRATELLNSINWS